MGSVIIKMLIYELFRYEGMINAVLYNLQQKISIDTVPLQVPHGIRREQITRQLVLERILERLWNLQSSKIKD